MAKRFTDNNKWSKVWFRKLTPTEKCFWIYLTDNCDHAGFWEVDWETVEHFIGTQIDPEEIKEVFSKQIIEIDNNKKWFIKDFIEFQYNCSIGELNPLNKVHNSVLTILKKYHVDEEIKGLARGLQGAKDKDKERDKDKDKKHEVLNYFNIKGYSKEEAESFYNHYEAQGWVTGNGIPITNWKVKAENWHKEQTLRNFNLPKEQVKCITLNT
ncbi:MAG: hypothetical protein FD143_2836 [Ignavibacteria bacterium]|nr:MAG: hypothetical protein FD143_2836 [Ignavibacteria bacterium]